MSERVSRAVATNALLLQGFCLRMAVCLGLLLALMMTLPGHAGLAVAADDYLDPESAFKFSARMVNPKLAAVTYRIAEGYYMYRERFAFRAEGATLGTPVFPQGKVKFDDTFKKNVETYRHEVTINVPVDSAGAFTLISTGQGCADQGLCYSPMESQARLSPTGGGGLFAALRGAAPAAVDSSSPAKAVEPATYPDASSSSGLPSVPPPSSASSILPSDATRGEPLSSVAAAQQAGALTAADPGETGAIESALKSGRLLAIVPLFLLLGLGLAFTPCVLPMVPILSSIIVGEGTAVSRRRGFLLSLTYAMGMAIVYTLLGVAAGLLGEGLAATLQNPWVLGSFGILMLALALSMFGVYELQVPGTLQVRLAQVSQNQRAGRLLGVFVMGALSALIVGPCVAAPLAGALVYISQTRDVVIGGSALFALAVGMSVPLLLVGVSAGALLPRAGMWMDAVKRFFGVLMLGVALWMVSPLLPVPAQMLGWAALGIGYGSYLLWNTASGWMAKAVGVAFVALGVLQLAGVATGGRDVLQPLAHVRGESASQLAFTRIKSTAQLDALLANTAGKTVMLDFYADWCVSCKEMEKLTFTDQGVQRRLANTLLLQADVTANDSDDRALLKRFGLFGPPGIILFDKQGREIPAGRVIGYQNAKRFTQSLAVLAPA